MKCIVSTAILSLSGAALAQGQYRADQPPVLAPADEGPVDHSALVVASFKERYSAVNRPRIVLFWNRELTDRIARQTYQKTSTSASKSDSSTTAGNNDNKSDTKLEQANTTTLNSVETVDDNLREQLDPQLDALLRTSFVAIMAQGGVQFVDRSLLVREAAAQAPGAVDAQQNEMKALLDRADWLLQVLPVRDAGAPFGYSFRVSLEDIKSETHIIDLYTPAIPPPRGRMGYVAVNGGRGFVRPPPQPVTVPEVGSALGLEIMSRLTGLL